MNWPQHARIIDVGLRDGLQNERAFVSTEDKVRLFRSLTAAGIRWIQVTSFVHPKWVPQLADAEKVAASAIGTGGAGLSALVPNARGYERALASGIRRMEFVIGASDTFNRHNVNMGTDESLVQFEKILAKAKSDGVKLRLDLATSFGCPYEGEVPPERVIELAKHALEAGAAELGIADTNGVANPRQVHELFSRLVKDVPYGYLVAHFHDTWGRGLANVVASLEAGITAFDASIGGMGGCPYCPGAAGNIATEDLVAMLESMHIGTDVDLAKLTDAAELAGSLLRQPLPSHALKARGGRCDTIASS